MDESKSPEVELFTGLAPTSPSAPNFRQAGLLPNLPYEDSLSHSGKIAIHKQRRLRRRRYAITSLNASPALHNIHSVEQFHRAASDCDIHVLKSSIASGTDPNISDEKGRTALHIASAKGHTDVVQLLLKHGANCNKRDAIGNTALHLAACTNHVDVITMLVNAGCEVQTPMNSGITPLNFVQGRLKLLQKNNSLQSMQIKSELKQIINLLQCLHRKSHIETEISFSSIQEQLSSATNKDDVDAITALLGDISIVKSTSHGPST